MIKKLKEILEFVELQRRGGTSTLIQEIAKKKDVIVLLAETAQEKDFHSGGVSFANLSKIKSNKPKPILVDNRALIQILRSSADEIEGVLRDFSTKNLENMTLSNKNRGLKTQMKAINESFGKEFRKNLREKSKYQEFIKREMNRPWWKIRPSSKAFLDILKV